MGSCSLLPFVTAPGEFVNPFCVADQITLRCSFYVAAEPSSSILSGRRPTLCDALSTPFAVLVADLRPAMLFPSASGPAKNGRSRICRRPLLCDALSTSPQPARRRRPSRPAMLFLLHFSHGHTVADHKALRCRFIVAERSRRPTLCDAFSSALRRSQTVALRCSW